MKKIILDTNKLPYIFEIVVRGIKKQYVLKTNREKSSLYLNIKEQY